MNIYINESFYNVTKNDNQLREALVDFGFEPMRHEVTYQSIGRTITLKKALEHINSTPNELKAFLHEKGIEVEFYESEED